MKTRAALMIEQPGTWQVTEVELEDPRQGELQIRMVASGLCHSDDHLASGDSPAPVLPVAGGHEGAAEVIAVGPNTPGWEIGDHVVLSFLPVCGHCRMCATGKANLCDLGRVMFTGSRPGDDDSFRMSLDGKPVAQMAGISTLSEFSTIDTRSAIKVPKHVDLTKAVLLGCGVATGWGSVTNMADFTTGDVVIVMGIGGIGINAVQAAATSGASAVIAVDPVEFKRDQAKIFGATHAVATMAEAAEIVAPLTNGQGADSTIVCIGVTDGNHMVEATESIRKGGTVVMTGLGHGPSGKGAPINNTMLTVYQKRIQGALYGGYNPHWAIPHLWEQYERGNLKLNELITRNYTLDQVNDGYADMLGGKNIRGVVLYE